MSEASMTAAINVSSTADRLLFTDLDPAWMGFHELTPQQEDDDDRKQQVDDGEGGKWYDQSGHRSHRIAGAHEPIDDPGLSSEFGHKPAGLYGNEAKRRTTDQRTQQPFVIWQPPSPPPDPSDPGGNRQHGRSGPHHDVERPVHQPDVWPLIAREVLQTDYLSLWIVANEQTQPKGDLKRVIYFPTSVIRNSAHHQRCALARLIMRFHRCEFSWLQLGNFLRCKISAHHLERNRDAGYKQRNATGSAMKDTLSIAQEKKRVDSGSQKR